jgi:hypothetical protein
MEALRATEVLRAHMREAQRWINELAPEVATQLQDDAITTSVISPLPKS